MWYLQNQSLQSILSSTGLSLTRFDVIRRTIVAPKIEETLQPRVTQAMLGPTLLQLPSTEVYQWCLLSYRTKLTGQIIFRQKMYFLTWVFGTDDSSFWTCGIASKVSPNSINAGIQANAVFVVSTIWFFRTPVCIIKGRGSHTDPSSELICATNEGCYIGDAWKWVEKIMPIFINGPGNFLLLRIKPNQH